MLLCFVNCKSKYCRKTEDMWSGLYEGSCITQYFMGRFILERKFDGLCGQQYIFKEYEAQIEILEDCLSELKNLELVPYAILIDRCHHHWQFHVCCKDISWDWKYTTTGTNEFEVLQLWNNAHNLGFPFRIASCFIWYLIDLSYFLSLTFPVFC